MLPGHRKCLAQWGWAKGTGIRVNPELTLALPSGTEADPVMSPAPGKFMGQEALVALVSSLVSNQWITVPAPIPALRPPLGCYCVLAICARWKRSCGLE